MRSIAIKYFGCKELAKNVGFEFQKAETVKASFRKNDDFYHTFTTDNILLEKIL